MAGDTKVGAATEISIERQMLKRSLTLLPLFGIIFFTVCGGSFGIEPLFGSAGPGMALLLIAIMPFAYSVPNILMVRELQSMMPVEGGYYHWTKQAFGPFTGFLTGWMNWVMSWVDVAIYPVFAATYLGFFIPALDSGAGGIPAWVLQWLVAIVFIWVISGMQIWGSRFTGLTSIWMAVILYIPLVIMSVVGFVNWGTQGSDFQMSFLPEGTGITGAFSLGLFVVMWNYMGFELPTTTGDEIVRPKRTYPLAMALVLVAAIATYAIPTVAGLYGGGGEGGRVNAWGIEESQEGAGIGPDLMAVGMTEQQIQAAGIDPAAASGWEFPDIANAVAEKSGLGSGFATFLGNFTMVAAILSMLGLFIGNSVSGNRVPFALAEDGMMPKAIVRVHRSRGTPWVAIVLCGVIFSVFSLQAFGFLIIIDVLLNSLTLLIQLAALWKLRRSRPEIPRKKIPLGYVGLFLVTILPTAVILFAIYSQVVEEGWGAVYYAVGAIVIGAILYWPIRRFVKIKNNIPDVDPYVLGDEDRVPGVAVPVGSDAQ